MSTGHAIRTVADTRRIHVWLVLSPWANPYADHRNPCKIRMSLDRPREKDLKFGDIVIRHWIEGDMELLNPRRFLIKSRISERDE